MFGNKRFNGLHICFRQASTSALLRKSSAAYSHFDARIANCVQKRPKVASSRGGCEHTGRMWFFQVVLDNSQQEA